MLLFEEEKRLDWFLPKWVHDKVTDVMTTFGNLKRFFFIIKKNCMEHLETKSQIRCMLAVQKKKKDRKIELFDRGKKSDTWFP